MSDSVASARSAGRVGGRSVYIALVGSSDATAAEVTRAEEVGRRLAEAGAVLVCGGLGGVMEAACRGANRGGGVTLGILPGGDRRQANEWVEVAVATGLGEARNVVVVSAADAVIAVGGEYGTLSEVGFALRIGRPVVALGSWKLLRGDGRADTGIEVATEPADAVDKAIRLARRR